MKLGLSALVTLAACGAAAHPRSEVRDLATEVTLYRDAALIKRRVEVNVGPDRFGTAKLTIPAGVAFEDLSVVDRGELTIRELHEADDAGSAAGRGQEVEVDVAGPRPGRFAFTIAYSTNQLTWEAAYTVTTTPAREHATVRGALAIRNLIGEALPHAHVWILDETFAAAKRATLSEIAPRAGASATTPPAVLRDLGERDLGVGESRLELLPESQRKVHAVLVYDPIGTALDNASGSVNRDRDMAIEPSKSTAVQESLEIARAPGDAGLPGGAARLLERHADGSLGMLADARLFDAATRVASADTVALGVAEGVTAHRDRRDFSVDDDDKRLVEEFSIDLDSTRAAPIDVVVREHIYRSQNWSIAYSSVPLTSKDKEGAQQVAMRTRVPAHGKGRVYYVVVYTW